MTKAGRNTVAKKPRLRVGSPVTLRLGRRTVEGQVVEDRGLIGVGRRRIYSVELRLGHDEPFVVELPADQIEKAPA